MFWLREVQKAFLTQHVVHIGFILFFKDNPMDV